MARYVECEMACDEIDKGDLLVGNNADFAKEIIYRTPTADVAPRSEVAREIFEEIEKYLQEKKRVLSMFKVAEDDFYEGELHALERFGGFLAELKQKYTEEQK